MTLTLGLVKEQLGVTGTDRDAMLTQYLNAAKQWVEDYTGKLLDRRGVEQHMDRFEPYLPLWYGPFVEFAQIDYTGTDGVAASLVDARLVGDRLYAPVAGWPHTFERTGIVVKYDAGFTEQPAPLVQAVLVLVRDYFDNNGSLTDGAERAVRSLCSPYRTPVIA